MISSIKWLLPASLTFSMGACAGDLKQPERFEIGQSGATADDAGQGGGNGGGGNGAGGCGSTVELLKNRCGSAGCHGGDSPAAKLDLVSADLGARLRDVPSGPGCEGYAQIDSADPAQSLIYLKVTDNPPCSSRMPIVGNPLSTDEQACLLEWLEQL